MQVYENQVIGTFLYGLGAAVQARSQSKINYSVMNLLQQTPADKNLADVLLEFGGVVRLIEFKRLENDAPKEKAKHIIITAAIADEYTIKLSKSIHWFIETTTKEQTLNSRIVPYLEAFSEKISQYTLEEFIETTAEDAVRGEALFSREELNRYFSLIDPYKGSRPTGAGALLLAVDSGGNVTYVVLSDMMELQLQHREIVQREMVQHREIVEERTIEILQALEKEIGRETEKSKSRSQGIEFYEFEF